MNVSLIYTAKTEALAERLHECVRAAFGTDTSIREYQDLSALTESAKAGHVTAAAAARYAGLCLTAIDEDADLVLSTCCVMGDVARALQPMADFTGTRLVSIDEGFCRAAVTSGSHMLVLATAGLAALSVNHTIELEKRKLRAFPQVDTIIVSETAGLAGDALSERLLEAARPRLDDIDTIVLAQPSMAFSGDYLRTKTGLRVLTAIDDPLGQSDLEHAGR